MKTLKALVFSLLALTLIPLGIYAQEAKAPVKAETKTEAAAPVKKTTKKHHKKVKKTTSEVKKEETKTPAPVK
jgi:hypothetical protein